jgi:hypothetical protein
MRTTDPRLAQSPQDIAAFLISKAADRTLALGPLVWLPGADGVSRLRYFIVGSADQCGEFHCDQIIGGEDDRLALLAALVAHKPLVIHDFNDELAMARFAEAVWPCVKITRIREQLEKERVERQEGRKK